MKLQHCQTKMEYFAFAWGRTDEVMQLPTQKFITNDHKKDNKNKSLCKASIAQCNGGSRRSILSSMSSPTLAMLTTKENRTSKNNESKSRLLGVLYPLHDNPISHPEALYLHFHLQL